MTFPSDVSIRTIPDPELPDSEHVLYFVLVEFNLENITELKRVVKLEMEGVLDKDTLGQFVEAWVLYGFKSFMQ